MRSVALVVAAVAAAALALAQSPESSYTLTLPGGTSTRATLAVRYTPDGSIDAATVTIARPDGKRRDQNRVTGEELSRTPGVLTPVKIFVTETWEGGADPFDVGEKRNLVLTPEDRQIIRFDLELNSQGLAVAAVRARSPRS